MGTKSEIFLSEKRILEDFDRSRSRLGIGREFYRLTNVMNDILDDSMLDFDNKNKIYDEIENFLWKEYRKTKKGNLSYEEMKVWHKSVFSCLDLFRRELRMREIKDTNEIPEIFKGILRKNLESRISEFRKEEGIPDFTEKLSSSKTNILRDTENNSTGYSFLVEERTERTNNQISSVDVSESNNTQKQIIMGTEA